MGSTTSGERVAAATWCRWWWVRKRRSVYGFSDLQLYSCTPALEYAAAHRPTAESRAAAEVGCYSCMYPTGQSSTSRRGVLCKLQYL